jgi:hypothetical protein
MAHSLWPPSIAWNGHLLKMIIDKAGDPIIEKFIDRIFEL